MHFQTVLVIRPAAIMSIAPFLWFFRCFCLAPSVPSNPMLSVILTLYSYLSLLGSLTFIVSFVSAYREVLTDNSVVIIVCALLIANLFIGQLVVVCTALTSRHQMNGILHQIKRIDRICVEEFQHSDLLSRTIQIRYARKIAIIIALIYFSYTYSLYIESSYVIFLLHPVLVLRACSVQLVFFVDLIDVRLNKLREELEKVAEIWRTATWDAQLQEVCFRRTAQLKALYGRVWYLSYAVKSCFGCSFLIISVENVAELIINTYLMFAACFTEDVPCNVGTQSFFGTLPALFTFSMMCYSCQRCENNVSDRYIGVRRIFSRGEVTKSQLCVCSR